MIQLLAETPGDQKMIEKFQRAYENLRKLRIDCRMRTGILRRS
jgi:hypothetical protein